MQAYEFNAKILKNGNLTVPVSIKKKLKEVKSARVILLFEDEEKEWKVLATKEFFKGYSEKDAEYDKL
jgi:ribosomal 50S subunit-recycling heat shock protein